MYLTAEDLAKEEDDYSHKSRFTNWGLIEFTNRVSNLLCTSLNYIIGVHKLEFHSAYEKGLMITFIPFTSKALEPCQWEYTIKMLMDYYHKPLLCS
ncbi:hypothetical protein P8452_56410 [Trifolium repens]|nr:hypothetical protein P8452_56410 [Trifolium repens]